ncbi:MAG: hypothetical protein PHF63_00520 [Herbinix sp.]|nr:hypothetical protein [Herbinix sp.]
MMNETSSVIFTLFEDVIKTPNIRLIKDITTKYFTQYSSMVDMSKIKDKTDERLHVFLMRRKHELFFEDIMKKSFNVPESYFYLHDNIEDLYLNEDFLDFAYSLDILNAKNTIEKINVWSYEYDDRINLDLLTRYPQSKISYVNGDYLEAIHKTKPHLICVNSLKYVLPLLDTDLAGVDILLAIYGYNFNVVDGYLEPKIPDIQEQIKAKGGKLNFFIPKGGISLDVFTKKEIDGIRDLTNIKEFN